MKPAFSAATLAAACAMSPLAWATAEGHATMSDLNYTLVDLDPDDGITPWIEFDPDSRELSTSLADSLGRSRFVSATPESYGSGAVSAVLGNTSGGASVSGTGGPTGAGAFVEGRVYSDIALPSVGRSRGRASVSAQFLISPQTRVVWTSRFHHEVAVEMSSTDQMSESAGASTWISLDDERHIIEEQESTFVGGMNQSPPGPAHASRDGEIVIAWDNVHETESLGLSYQCFTVVSASVVPEPATLGLMALGLPLMACATRRRRTAT